MCTPFFIAIVGQAKKLKAKIIVIIAFSISIVFVSVNPFFFWDECENFIQQRPQQIQHNQNKTSSHATYT